MKTSIARDRNVCREGSLQLACRKHGGQCKTYFISLKSGLAFQTLMTKCLANGPQLTRGLFSWARTAPRLCCLDRSDFKHKYLDFISLFEHQKAHRGSLKLTDDLWVYQGFLMPLNHHAGRHARYFKRTLQLLVDKALKHRISFLFDGISSDAWSISHVCSTSQKGM